jgi:uncharacterized membrane protein YraQ (UPF0718 family)
MTAWIWNVLVATWQVWVLMAPYLLVGFVAAGLLTVVLSPAWVRRHMGGRGLWQVIKASLLGVPLPLCSCGVLPVAFSLRNHGASKGATVSFLASTPQTGVDSIVATYAVLGPVVTVFRVVAAFVSGVLAGGLVTAAYPHDPPRVAAAPDDAVNSPTVAVPAWRRMLRLGLVTLPRDVARPLLVGVLISGVLTACVPAGFFEGRLPPGWGAYAMALLVGIPLYVCSTASIPLAASFIYMGAPPGAAMAFLIAGPATNAATIAVMWTRIGRMGTVLYLFAIAATAVAAGALMDTFFPGGAVPALSEQCTACADSWWRVAAALVLLALVLPGLLPERDDE